MNVITHYARLVGALGACALLTAGVQPSIAANVRADITITTTKMKIPGMENIQLPAGIPVPPELANMMRARRGFSVFVTAPGAPAADASATMDAPDGLQAGTPLVLSIDRPTKPDATGTDAAGGAEKPMQMKMLLYWGCGEAVGTDQPKSTAMDSSMNEFLRGYNPHLQLSDNNTRASWPGGQEQRPVQIKDTAHTPGDYTLHTSFAGKSSFKIAADQDFLAPIDVTAPQGTPDLAQAIPVTWNKVPNALGYQVTAMGSKEGDGVVTMVIWTSAHKPLTGGGTELRYDDTARAVEAGLLLAPDTTSCTIPAGILNGLQGVMLTVEAIGPTRVVGGNIPMRISTHSMAMITMAPGTGD